ncbi:MAG TPA: hypothetical protein VFU40_01275 [Gemmatimonadales bacterium]|nr:hypothetical protein [Gemmatimonadales bacterium]
MTNMCRLQLTKASGTFPAALTLLRSPHLHRLALAVLLGAAACAGDGTGLDEHGNPVGEGRAPLQPTFTSIQTHIFTPSCTQCHAGAAAPLGFSLEAAVSYESLVNVASVERPAVLRVKPGAPDSSYLVLKLEGAAGIAGGRMPLGLPPLSTGEVSVVREWILAGALRN